MLVHLLLLLLHVSTALCQSLILNAFDGSVTIVTTFVAITTFEWHLVAAALS